MNVDANQAAVSFSSSEGMGELLHSLSQPLTSLRCALELSMMEEPDSRPGFAAALQQTDAVIEIVARIRAYVEAHSEPESSSALSS